MGLMDGLRRLASTRDERGRVTSDRFRYAVRKRVRRIAGGVDGPVLDAGGGDGLLFDPRVSAAAERVTVLDLDTEALVRGRGAYGGTGRFVCGDITRMPFRDGVFNFAVCVGTFYNFPSRYLVASGIGELARVTARGGTVATEFRNLDNPVVAAAYRHARAYDPSLADLPLRAYRPVDAIAMAESAGLKVREIAWMGPPFRRLAFGFIIVSVRV